MSESKRYFIATSWQKIVYLSCLIACRCNMRHTCKRVVLLKFYTMVWARIQTLTLDFFIWGSCPASLRNVDCSTQVLVPARNNARKGTWCFPPTIKLERRHMTVWRKTQSNKHTVRDFSVLILFDRIIIAQKQTTRHGQVVNASD
jgi:hypothetical protein